MGRDVSIRAGCDDTRPKRPFVRAAVSSLALVAALTGCSLFDKKSDGPPIEVNVLPPKYRATLLEFLKGHLADPFGVREASITEPRLQPIGTESRYVVCVRFNAKDGYGQYTGAIDHVAIYFAGKLTQFVPATREQCSNAPYQPFPELEQLKK